MDEPGEEWTYLINDLKENLMFAPRYKTKVRDVAIIRLREPVKLFRSHRPICFSPREDFYDMERTAGWKVAGWGKYENSTEDMRSRYLRVAEVLLRSKKVCERKWPQTYDPMLVEIFFPLSLLYSGCTSALVCLVRVELAWVTRDKMYLFLYTQTKSGEIQQLDLCLQ